MKLFIAFLMMKPIMAFVPKFPPSSLQSIVTSRAIISTFSEKIGEELMTNNYVFQDILIDHSKNHFNMDLFYLMLLGFVLSNARTNVSKFSNWEWFSDIQKKTNILILVLMIIFNRNVENAI
jgi:hypothetical protein